MGPITTEIIVLRNLTLQQILFDLQEIDLMLNTT